MAIPLESLYDYSVEINQMPIGLRSESPDNKRMNAECSIWRVLIFGVNFAPGYPRRYPARSGVSGG